MLTVASAQSCSGDDDLVGVGADHFETRFRKPQLQKRQAVKNREEEFLASTLSGGITP